MAKNKPKIRTFKLIRNEDVSGVSGTGLVAQGVEFNDGTCAMRWLSAPRSTTFYNNINELTQIHGHGLKTVVHFDDKEEKERGTSKTLNANDLEKMVSNFLEQEGALPNVLLLTQEQSEDFSLSFGKMSYDLNGNPILIEYFHTFGTTLKIEIGRDSTTMTLPLVILDTRQAYVSVY